jgi:lipoprotein-releasing system permease protein
MPIFSTQGFENFMAYRYLKADKFRGHVFISAIILISTFLLIFALNIISGKLGSSKALLFNKVVGWSAIALLILAFSISVLALTKIISKKSLYFTGTIFLITIPLVLLAATSYFSPELISRVKYYLLYYYLIQLSLGILVLIFGTILLFFNVHSTTSIFSVFLGTTTMVVVLSVLGGLEGEQKSQILGFSPHIVISNKNKNFIENYRKVDSSIRDLLSKHKIKNIMAPYLEEEVLLKSTNFEATQGILLRGIDPKAPTFDLESHMKSGTIDNLTSVSRIKWVDPSVTTIFLMNSADPISFLPPWPADSPGIIISQEQAKTLGISIGKSIDIISPRGTMSPTGPIPKMLRFRVAGIYSTKHFKYDLKFAFVSLKMVQSFSRKPNAVSGWELRLDDEDQIDSTAVLIRKNLADKFKVGTWKTRNSALFNAMKLEKIIMFIILVVIILVAAFSITANLIMVVMDKQQEIAILKSQGATDLSIRMIFILQGLLVGIIGLILGLIAGMGICIYLAVVGIRTSENIFILSRIPVSVNVFDIIAISFAAIVLTALATLYPSWKATKITPIEGLAETE